MTFKPLLRNLAALALTTILVWCQTGAAAAATLPRLEADALGGTHVVFPTDAAGKPLVLLLAYTPESENDLKSWSRSLLGERLAHDAAVYVVVVAVKTAFMSRKHIRNLVEGSAIGSKEQINTNVLITFNGNGWLTLVPPGDKTTAGVVVCDANGTIGFAQRISYSPAHLADVERTIK